MAITMVYSFGATNEDPDAALSDVTRQINSYLTNYPTHHARSVSHAVQPVRSNALTRGEQSDYYASAIVVFDYPSPFEQMAASKE